MSTIADIVDVSITANTVAPSAESFDVGMAVGYHTKYTDRVRSYSSLLDLVADGFASTDALYRMAAAFFSTGTNPHPKTLKIGRRASVVTQTIEITPIASATGTIYSGEINGLAWTYTQGVTQTVAAACTGIAAAIDALAGVAATVHTSTSVRVTTDTAGKVLPYSFDQNVSVYKIGDITAAPSNPSITDDLNAIQIADPSWYAFSIDSESPAEVLETTAWNDSQKKVFAHTLSDSDAFDAGVTSDAPSTMKAAARGRTVGIFNGTTPGVAINTYAGLAWISNRLVDDPGSDTWAFKTLPGIIPDGLTSTQQSALEGKNVNHYQTVAGKSITRKGVVYSGQYVDVVRGIDWLQARIAERVFGLLANNRKLPYTDASIELVKGEIQAQLDAGVRVGFLVAGTVIVTAPRASEVSSADKAARLLPNVQFSAELAGAIHKTTIAGVLSV